MRHNSTVTPRVTQFDGHISNPIFLERVFFYEQCDRATDKKLGELMLHIRVVVTYLILYSATLLSGSTISSCILCIIIIIIIYVTGEISSNVAVELHMRRIIEA